MARIHSSKHSSKFTARIQAATKVLAAFALALLLLPLHAQQVAARITQPVDDTARTVLHGGTPPLVSLSTDMGVVPDSTPAARILLVFKRSDAQAAALSQTLANLHNPGSPQYHHWLTPQTFASQFGPSDTDIQTIAGWLESQGFTVKGATKGKAALEFSGTAGQVRAAFHTELHTYQHDGTTFHSNNTDPQIPAALTPVVAGIAALNDIPPVSYSRIMGKALFNPKTHATQPEWSEPVDGGGVYLVTAPGDLAVQYDINPIYNAGTTGAGETIGIVSQSGVDNTTIANYHTLFNLPSNLPTEIIDGTDPGDNGDGAGTEADLDVEVSGSTAPNANIYLYTSSDTTVSSGLFEASVRVVDDNIADVISVSYGICEATLGLSGNLLYSQLWSQAAAQGQSVFVSAGDSGGAGCDNGSGSATHGLAVSGITSTPYNVSVGGTDFYYSNYANSSALTTQIDTYWNTAVRVTPTVSILQTIPEQPWNDAFGLNAGGAVNDGTTAAGSGGVSSCTEGTSAASSSTITNSFLSCTSGYAKPSWQSAPGVPQDGVRDVPDVSLFAANGENYSFYPVCAAATDCNPADLDPTTGAETITGVGGTSASSPLMAGIMALIDQSLKGRQGNPNFVLYALANQAPSVFHDITVGNNNVPCTEGTNNCSLDTNGDGYYSLQEYPAEVGYDLASGLGSVDANALLTNWNKATFSSTTTTLALSSTSFAHGTPVTVTSVVSSPDGTPTGVVALVNSSTASPQLGSGTLTLTNGTGQATFNSLPAGNYTLTAQYGGNGTLAASTSDAVSLNVTPENAKIAISGTYYGVEEPTGNVAPPAPITNGLSALYGSFFYLDVQVYGASSTPAAPDGIATGTVTIYDNGTLLTTMSLGSKGIAELPSGSFAAGVHVLTFSYSGDGSFNAVSAGSPFTLNINQGPSTVIFSEGIPSGILAGGTLQVPVEVTSSYGQLPLTGTITVTFGSQTQTVQLTQSEVLGESSVGYGTATFNLSTPGTYNLNASYSGDNNLQPVSTAYNPMTISVFNGGLTPTTTVLTMSSLTLSPEGTLTATVKVTGGSQIPTGSVTLMGNSSVVSFFNELDSTGTVIIPLTQYQIVANGTVQFVATYSGDNNNGASMSAPVSVTANVGDYSLTSSAAAIAINSGSTGTAIISAGAPLQLGWGFTGTVALSCAMSSPELGCSFSPTTLTLPSNPIQVATSTLTITTQPASTASAKSTAPARLGRYLGGSAAGLAMLLFLIPMGKRRRPMFLAFFLAIAIGGLSGCSHGTIPVITVTNNSAPTGSYTATVTAVGSGVTHTLVIRVTVQ
jgi:trimeric autotransporter adhesin